MGVDEDGDHMEGSYYYSTAVWKDPPQGATNTCRLKQRILGHFLLSGVLSGAWKMLRFCFLCQMLTAGKHSGRWGQPWRGSSLVYRAAGENIRSVRSDEEIVTFLKLIQVTNILLRRFNGT